MEACDSPSQILQRSACQSMLVELTGGAETTAQNLTEFERLSRMWMSEMSEGDPAKAEMLIEPAYGEESFLSFLNWIVTDAGRARSFVTLARGFGIALSKMKLTNWTKGAVGEGSDQNDHKHVGAGAGAVRVAITAHH